MDHPTKLVAWDKDPTDSSEVQLVSGGDATSSNSLKNTTNSQESYTVESITELFALCDKDSSDSSEPQAPESITEGYINVVSTSNVDDTNQRSSMLDAGKVKKPSLKSNKASANGATGTVTLKVDVGDMYQKLLNMKGWKVKMVLIYNSEEKICKMCGCPIENYNEVMEHFMIHFTPCCTACAEDNCDTHSVPIYQHKENYYQNFTHHKFVKLNRTNGAMLYKCSACKILFRASSKHSILEFFYFCPTDSCIRSFACREEFIVHLLSHLAWQVCKMCDKVDSFFRAGHDHDVIETHFECESCSKEMTDENLYIQHLRGCTKNVAQRFRNAVAKSLEAEDQLERLFVRRENCLECSTELMSRQSLKEHLSNHLLIICPLCTAPLDSMDAMTSHCINSHKTTIFRLKNSDVKTLNSLKNAINFNPAFSRLVCCMYQIPDLELKEKFLRRERAEGSKMVSTCLVCSMKIENEQDIETHYRVHLSPCCRSCNINQNEYCDVHQSVLLLHPENYFVNLSCHKLQASADSMHFKCENCAIVYGTKPEKALIKQLFQKFHQCDECNLDNLHEDKISAHILSHIARKVCNFCSFSTVSSVSAREHVAMHRGKMDCASCSQVSSDEISFGKHYSTCEQGLRRYMPLEEKLEGIQMKEAVAYCRTCDFMIDNLDHMTHHRYFHMLLVCPFCRIALTNFELHILNCHPDLEFVHINNAQLKFINTLKMRVEKIIAHAKKCSEIDISSDFLLTPLRGEGKRKGQQILTISVPNRHVKSKQQ